MHVSAPCMSVRFACLCASLACLCDRVMQGHARPPFLLPMHLCGPPFCSSHIMECSTPPPKQPASRCAWNTLLPLFRCSSYVRECSTPPETANQWVCVELTCLPHHTTPLKAWTGAQEQFTHAPHKSLDRAPKLFFPASIDQFLRAQDLRT